MGGAKLSAGDTGEPGSVDGAVAGPTARRGDCGVPDCTAAEPEAEGERRTGVLSIDISGGAVAGPTTEAPGAGVVGQVAGAAATSVPETEELPATGESVAKSSSL